MRDRDVRAGLFNQAQALYQVMRPVGSTGPSDFRLSGLLKKKLDCRRFATDAYMKQATNRSDVKTHTARCRPTVVIQATSQHKNT